MGTNAFVTVLGIGTCKLESRGGRILYLHDVFYAIEIRQNLAFVLVLLELGFHIIFTSGCVKVFLDNVYYDFGYLLNGFMVLDTVNISMYDDTSIYIVGNSNVSNDNESIIWHG